MKITKSTIAIAIAASLVKPVAAQTFVRLGIDGGGEELLSLQYTNGITTSVTTGSGVSLEAGAIVDTPLFENRALSTELSLGYKFDESVADNGSATFSRVTLNANQFYHIGAWRLGAGLTYHFATQFTTEGSFLGNNEIKFDNAAGVALMVEYTLKNMYQVGLRAVSIDYQDSFDNKIDGSSAGLYLGAKF